MSGYIDNYRWDLSPAVEALKAKMQDRANQRKDSMNAFTSVANLMGKIGDSAYKSMEQNKAEIDQLMKSDDGITKEELLAKYPMQKDYINSLFKAQELASEAQKDMEGYKPNMTGYVPSFSFDGPEVNVKPNYENSIAAPLLENALNPETYSKALPSREPSYVSRKPVMLFGGKETLSSEPHYVLMNPNMPLEVSND